jgi:hypothetical protein
VTDGLDVPASREDQVDRGGLAAAVNARMAELRITQAQLARKSGVSVASLRLIQKAQGKRYYGGDLLADLSRALGWPADYLLRVFHRLPQVDAATPSEIDIAVQAVMDRIHPYLAEVDALKIEMSNAMDAIHRVNGRIDAIIDIRHPPAED